MTQLEAGTAPPPTTFYSSRYSISTNRVTCSICHNPHGEAGSQLLRATKDNDLICQQCHVNFYVDNPQAQMTHPIGNYAAAYDAAPTPKKYKLTGDIPNNALQGITLVNGNISCSTCHAPHFADSDSSTADGLLNVTNLNPGDGHLLKADGPFQANKSALCQTCHTYMEHGKVGNNAAGSGAGDVQIGCLVCHSGHSYDATAPNFFVLRKTVDSGVAGYGIKSNVLYTTYPTSWATYCVSCHGAVTGYTLRPHSLPADNDCKICHAHNGTAYSFAQGSSGTACSSCHGAPPRTNTAADRVDNTVPDTGYAVGQIGINYLSANQNGKDESQTPHKRHAGALEPDKAAVDYAFGSGTVLSACLPCHNDKEDAVSPPSPSHDKADSNLSFQDVYFNSMATYNGVLTAPLYKKTSGGGQWACSGIYCHSNGGKRRTDGAAKAFADFKTATTPAWPLGSNNTTNIGTIVGTALECQQCHGADRASMVLAQKNNSPTHDKHLLKLGDGKTKCYLCHSATVDSNGTIPATARDHRFGGTHVNGTPNVVFSSTAFGGDLATGTYASGVTQGTCVVYCHSDAIGGPPAIVPDWDIQGNIVCGSCHGITSATLTSGSHIRHIDSSKAKIKCSSCHGLNADTGTHSGHVDGAITKLTYAESCDLCHGVELASGKAWDVSPTWGSAGSIDCRTCHTGSVVTSYVNTAEVTISVTTANNLSKTLHESDGHSRTTPFTLTGKPAASKNCSACHTTIQALGTGHVDGLGTSKLLIGGFSCEACHTAAGSRSGEATVDVQSHGNQTAGYTKKAYNAAFTKTCLACHDPHGTSNGAMIENLRTKQNAKDATANFAGNVVFSSLLLGNSFDESDTGASANNDDICATCHSTTLHNNRAAAAANHHEGENCTTTCHGHNGAKGGFMPTNGTACNDCHGNPPSASDPKPAESVGAHAAHTKVGTHAPTEDLFDCAVCHQGGESFALDGAHSSAPLVAAIGYNAGDGTCSGACHLSTAIDGYWNDSNGLDCASCHYYDAVDPTSGGNIVKALSPTHNKHFDAGKDCIDCHADNSADAGPHPDIDLKRTHIDDHELWSLNATNDGSVLADRGAAAQDEATVIVTTWNDGADTCSNAACHNPSGLSNTATWGNTNAVGCNFCHSSTNPDAGKGTPGSHGAHMNAAGTFGITTIACTSCHPNNTLNGHLNSAVDLNGGFVYNASLTDYTSSTFGQCTTTTCHNNGKGTAVQTPVPWGTSYANCTICHNNGSGAAQPNTGRHNKHVANTSYVASACGNCHANATATTMTGATTHINGTAQTGIDITAHTAGTATCTNNCHLVDLTRGDWLDANFLTCTDCHGRSGSAGGAYPASGLHTGTLTVSANTHDNSFKVTKAEGSPSGTCLTCHTATPSTAHKTGTVAASDAVLVATVGYTAGSPATCGPNGALVNCHDDKGAWKRRWSTTATASTGAECGNCHGNFDLTWVTGISQRHSSDAQIHGGHNGAGVNDCYICHTFGWAVTYPAPIGTSGKHRDGNIQLNSGMVFTDDGATVHCTGCHDGKPLGLADGQYSFQDTNSADGADGGLNRWLRMEQAGPPANCNGCHAATNGLDHDGVNESLTVHDYHTGSPLAAGCGPCHPADSGPGGALHQNNSLDFGGTYLSLTAYAVTPGVGGNFTNTNCSTANGCHNSELNSWKNDTLAGCADCHAATGKLVYTGSGLSGWPMASNEHQIHIDNDDYVGATAITDCDDCHGTGASAPNHLPAHNDGALTIVATGSKITQLNPDKSCTNSCHATASGREWDSATTLVCVDCHSGTYLGKVNKNNISGLHQTNVAMAHDEAFPRPNAAPDGTCTSCHDSINLTTPASHVDGVTTDPNTAFGLFASYDTSAASTCSGSGVATNCHSDGGDWTRKWNNVANAKPLPTDDPATATVCRNCHGTFFTGWNSLSASHIDPDLDNSGDQMQAGGHLVCEKCHGWGNASYNKTWLGSSNINYDGHGDGHITMNGPVGTGTGYNPATRGCDTINCHGASTLTLNTTSGWAVNYGNFGGAGACGACHDDGAIPPNSGAHAAHGADNDSDYSECEACHGTNNGGDWATGSGGTHNTGTVNFAAGITYSDGGTAGTNAAAANDTCATTQCHSKSPEVATWGTPASLGCDECHNATATVVANNAGRTLSNSHNTHFAKGKTCTQCHTVLANRTHISAGSGTDGFILTGRANAAQDEATVTMTLASIDGTNRCSGTTGISLGCHNTKTTPVWGTTGIGCSNCHVPSGGAAADPASGLHAITPTVSATRHDGTLASGNCVNCHSATSPSSLHQNGSLQNSGTATFTFHSNVSGYSASGCTASCHSDAGGWARKWSTTAANTDGAECANCHGGIGVGHTASTWNTGIVPDHTANWDSDVNGPEVMTSHSVCKSCHGFNGAADKDDNYLLTMHRNNQITMNGGTSYNAGNYGCDNAGCHGTAAAAHALADSGWAVELGDFAAGGSCFGCHGNGVDQYWPDGSAYPDRAGAHSQHIPEIAAKMTGGNTLANRNATCIYCHPGGAHSGDQSASPADICNTDTDNNGAADANTADKMIKLILNAGNPVTDSNGFWRSTPGTCSNVACHANAPFTPHWYADLTAPGNVTLTAVAGPVPRSIKLTWTAVGDDDSIDGTAYKYDIRMGSSSAVATNFDPSPTATNYVKGVPTVKRMGSAQETIIHGVDPSTTYYFALRTYDRAGNYGGTANAGGYVSYAVSATPDTTAPVMTGSPSWYGLDSAKALDDGTVKLSWTRAEDHSMPITYDIWWSTGTITYGTVSASTKDTSFRVTGLTAGQTYNFAVRAKDAAATPNRDTNTIVLQAIPLSLSTVPKTDAVYYANGTATTNIPMQVAVHTTNGTTTTYPAIFISPTTFTANTTIFANSFSINVDNGSNPSTLRAELGYITGTNTWNSFSTALFATDQTIAKRAVRVVTFKFNGAQRSMTSAMNAKLGVRVSVSFGAIDLLGWGPTSKGGILSIAVQPVNISPTVPTVTSAVTGANVSMYWTASTDSADGVADAVHYDVFGSANGGADGFPYVIATGLTTNATVGAPLVWDTQAAGILAPSSTVQVKVQAGDVINGKVLSHTPSVPTNLTVDNSGDNVAPGIITNLKAETRPKQGAIAISWTAPGDDGNNNGRAASYDIRWANAVIDDDTKYNAATPLVSEPYPDFGGNGQIYEAVGLAPGTYYFAIKAVDEGSKTSPLAYTTATTSAGPKCGICHSTPPDESASIGNHAKHGYTMAECGNCHGTEAATFTTAHQDGAIKLGWKTATPAVGTKVGYQVTYTQGGQTIYQDASPGGFNVDSADTGDKTDSGSCSSWSTLGVSGCHGPATSASWTAAATLPCSSCHGVASRTLDQYSHSFDDPSDDIKSAPPIDNHGYDGTGATEAERKFVGAHVPHLNSSFRMSKGDSCRLCHGASRPGASTHADGIIDIQLDKAAAGATATWTPGTAITAGTCGSMDPSACHPSTATPTWDSNAVFYCTNCHGFASTTPSHVTDPNKLINLADNDADSGDPMPGNCTWCHVGGHPKEKKVVAITTASPAVVTTENNHNLATNDKVTIHTKTGMTEINNKTFLVTVLTPTSFSLQGSNSTTYTTFDYGTWIEGNGTGIILVQNDSRVGINYLSGGVHLKANIGARGEVTSEAELCWSCHAANSISEWGADSAPTNVETLPGNGNNYNFGTLNQTNWVGATWTSGTTGTYGFGYKTGTIRSTHSTDTVGTAALTGTAYNYSNGGVDTVGKIRCSNCHDVHNTTNSPMEADGLNPDGAPYLRGTWKSNPYKEDGAPIAGQTYEASAQYGTVPRALATTTNGMGGYWIDQNSGMPTAGWSYETSASLCQLCHGTSVDALDQVTDENLWISATNGHANSVLGGSGTGAANIFLQGAAGGRNGTIGALGGTAGVNPNVGGWMGFQNTASSVTADYGYGPRSAKGAYILPYQTSQIKISVLVFAWGNAVDAGTTEIGYHQFSCSKCHNPHASRLPKLMITNCLDVTHNTWDSNYTGDASWSSFNSATSSWGTTKLSHLSTAQNCHRYIDVNGDNTPDEKGWNKVTPW